MQTLDDHLDAMRSQVGTQLNQLAALVAGDSNAALDTAALVSCQMDGSGLDTIPDEAERLEASAIVAAAGDANTGPQEGWHAALVNGELVDEDKRHHAVAVVEFINLRAALDPAWAPELTDTLSVAASTHSRITEGLIPAGSLWRTSSQVLQDGNTGLVLYRPPEPEALPAMRDRLRGMSLTGDTPLDAVVAAGRALVEILRVHPFEAANGRVARAVSRHALRAALGSSADVLAFEAVIASQPLALPKELGARRQPGDMRNVDAWWLEVISEALAMQLYPDAPGELIASMATRVAPAFTVKDWSETTGVAPQMARSSLHDAAGHGRVLREHGTLGLRFRSRS